MQFFIIVHICKVFMSAPCFFELDGLFFQR